MEERSCSSSPLALLWPSKAAGITYACVAACRWEQETAALVLEAADTMEPLEPNDQVIAAYGTQVAVCTVSGLETIREPSGRCELQLGILRSDFIPLIEGRSLTTTADQFAEMRARRLLLDEYPTREANPVREVDDDYIVEIGHELFIAGQNTFLQVKRSPFPFLFRQLGRSSRFLHAAWINAVMVLKLSAIVVSIESFSLNLDGDGLRVEFRGKRLKKYPDTPACEIRVSGTCPL